MKLLKWLFSLIYKLIPSIAILIFNLTNVSIINFIREKVFNMPKLTGSTRVSVDSAIVAMIVIFCMSIFQKRGKINANIRSNDDEEVVKLRKIEANQPISLKIDCKIDRYGFFFPWLLDKLGETKLIIKNEAWTSIEIENVEQYEYVNTDNASEKIEIKLLDENKHYYTLLVLSDKSVTMDGVIGLDVEHTNKFMNLLLKLIFEVNCGKQKIIYR